MESGDPGLGWALPQTVCDLGHVRYLLGLTSFSKAFSTVILRSASKGKNLANAPGNCYQVHSADILGVLSLSEEKQGIPASRRSQEYVSGKSSIPCHPVEDASGCNKAGWRIEFSYCPFVQHQDPSQRKGVVRSLSAQPWPRSPTLPFWVLLRPRSDMPTLPLQPTHPTRPLRHMCTLARLVILAAPFALLADEAVSGIKHKVPIHLC